MLIGLGGRGQNVGFDVLRLTIAGLLASVVVVVFVFGMAAGWGNWLKMADCTAAASDGARLDVVDDDSLLLNDGRRLVGLATELHDE